jgi:hypothetical protein
MNPHPRLVGALALLVATWLAAGAAARAEDTSSRKPEDPKAATGIEVQARGPIHEAFAQPTPIDAGPTTAVAQKPPAAIPELPPDQKPAGKNVQWIPGYWAWYADKKDFLWVSGTWRGAPAGRQWVPGYWANTKDGWQWVPGFWSDASKGEVPYLKEPPEPLDSGEPPAAPDANSFWVPGCWLPYPDRFVWRPGFWSPCHDGQVWIPSRYCWTPNGYCFVNGYWDYPLGGRGLLFAPVCFGHPFWNDPSWSYRPGHCVNFPALMASLFVQPGFGHFYFGDYYGAGYRRLGFTPWLAYGPRSFDPLYRYYSWQNRNNPAWQRTLEATNQGRVAGTAPLPPRTLAAQNTLMQQTNLGSSRGLLQMVDPLGKANADVPTTTLSSAQLAAQRSAVQQSNRFLQQRTQHETNSRVSSRYLASGPQRSTAPLRLPGNAGPDRPDDRGLSFSPRWSSAGTAPSSARYGSYVPRQGYVPPSSLGTSYRPAPSYYRAAPSFSGPAPSFSRPAPSFSGGSYRGGGGGFHGGGGHGGGGHGHR